MKIRSLLSAGLFGVFSTIGAMDSSIAAEDNATALFGALPTFGEASLSASGRYLAFATPIEGDYNVTISEVDSPGKIRRIAFGRSEIVSLHWSGDGYLLVRIRTVTKDVADLTDSTFYQTFIVSTANTAPPLPINRNGHLGFDGGNADQIVDLSPDPTHIYVSALERYDNRRVQYKLLKVDLTTGSSSIANEGKLETAKWFSDGAGHVLARVDAPGPEHDDVMIPSPGQFRKIATLNTPGAPATIVAVNEDGRSLAVALQDRNGRSSLHSLDLASGVLGASLYQNANSDFEQVILDRRLRAIGVLYRDGEIRSAYFSPDLQRVQKQIESVLPGRAAHLLSTTADGNKTIVLTTSAQSPPALHFVNLSTSRIDNIGESYPQLRGIRLAEVQRFDYRTRDGYSLTGVLMLPPGRQPNNLPLVVLPGPFGYGLINFDWFAQFLAHQGYAVLEAGKRSTRGLFDMANIAQLREWRAAKQEDIGSAVEELVVRKIADPNRLCIIGNGDDGYTALSSLMSEKTRYACAVAFRPVTDLGMIVQDTRYNYSGLAYNNFNSALIRNHEKFRTNELDDVSLVKRADLIQGSVLLIDTDKVFWDSHSLHMRDALQRANKHVDRILLKDEDGELSRAESRVALLNAVDKFLAAQIGN